MRKLTLILLTATALAGCKQQATPTAAPSEAAAITAAGPASANGTHPGAFQVTAKDGTVTTDVLNADGSYTDSDSSGKVTGTGTWTVKDNKTCFTATKGSDSGCYTESAPGADGTFTATPDKGDPVTVKPIVLSAADMAGTYDYTFEGKARTSVMKADGSYEDTVGGKVVESGTWSTANGEVCFDDKKDPPQCWTTTKPDAKGGFTATSTDGKTVLAITKHAA
jgi:hypothetical protein